jgi:hypothetical protein
MNFELIADQAAECLLFDLNNGHCVDIDSVNYADDFWFAGYCLATSFVPTPVESAKTEIELDYILCLMSRGFDYEFAVGCYADVNPF